ncbi:prosaposin-like [Dreissena polymorpha]|uniref:Saposin B-type domain-containing protein n=1 Tax=Dreissena polymorpha TaxID=45954 RepID=A0A9D4M8H1_DREPO|nr:prosaposin-like [Dreissena polymorpha]KAH3871729.1 hypothetical protein DPMN_034941 [Dreissena polymorpha]
MRSCVVLALVVLVPLISAAPGADQCSKCMELFGSVGPQTAEDVMSAKGMCGLLGQCETAPLATVEYDYDVTKDISRNSALCHICRVITSTLHRFLADPKWQQVILRLLKLVCKYLPYIGNTCTALVNEYGTMAIEFLGKFVQPQICNTLFHICPNMTDAMFARDDCRVCEFGFGIVYDTVNDRSLHDQLQTFSSSFCETEQPSKRKECVTSLRPFADGVMKLAAYIKNDPEFQGFCQKNNMCPAGLYMP